VLDGLILVSVGVPARTARVRELLVWVPFTTVIFGVPAKVKRDAPIDAVSFVSETCVVVTPFADPFHWTVPPVKPLPFTVRVKAVPFALALVGDSADICGPVNEKLLRLMSHAPRP
jgi:hypothetical protein